MPMPTLVRAFGWENHANIMRTPFSAYTRTTSSFSPRGGIAGGLITGAAMADSRASFGSSSTPTDGTTSAYCFDFRVSSAAADAILFNVGLNGGTAVNNSLYFDTATGFLGWYQQAGFTTTGKGSLVGTAGTFTVAGTTWYRLWVSVTFNSSTGDFRMEARIASATTDPSGATAIDAFYTGNLGNTAISWGMGGQHGGSGIAGQNLIVDNDARFDGVTYGEEWYVACVAGSISGNGTDQDMTVTNTGGDTQHYQAVDETTPNGSGTTDSDFVRSNAVTTAVNETYAVTVTPPTGYYKPVGMNLGVFHRNANAGKWVGGQHRTRTYNNSVQTNHTGTFNDPGTSYVSSSVNLSGNPSLFVVLAGDREQMVGLQVGVHQDAAAGEAADRKIDAVGVEVAYMRDTSLIVPRERSYRRSGMMRARARGERRRVRV